MVNDTGIVSLSLLRSHDTQAVNIASSALQKDGFVFLDVQNDELMDHAVPVMQDCAAFLQGPGYRAGSTDKAALTGHVSSLYKDSFKLLSGSQYKTNSTVPVEGLNALVCSLDRAATNVVEALAEPLFGCSSVQEVGKKFDLPLLRSHNDDTGSRASSYGLVDIVCYRNEKGAPEVVVSEHCDPGLFILALPEVGKGLELRNRSGQWVRPPNGYGVLWAGRAAEGVVVPATHRVCSHVGVPRVSCWHEICTASQIAPPLLHKLKENGVELTMGAVKGTDNVLEALHQAENHYHGFPIKRWLRSLFPWLFQRIVEVPGPPPGVPFGKIETAIFRMPVRISRERKE